MRPSSTEITTKEVTEGGEDLDEVHGVALIVAGQQHGHVLEFLNVGWRKDAHCVIPWIASWKKRDEWGGQVCRLAQPPHSLLNRQADDEDG